MALNQIAPLGAGRREVPSKRQPQQKPKRPPVVESVRNLAEDIRKRFGE